MSAQDRTTWDVRWRRRQKIRGKSTWNMQWYVVCSVFSGLQNELIQKSQNEERSNMIHWYVSIMICLLSVVCSICVTSNSSPGTFSNQGFRLLADDVCHQMGYMQCHLCATKQAQKSNNTKVAMLTRSTNDVFLSVFKWTNMQMRQRYFMLHPIIPCHSLVTYHCGHVITSTIPFTYEREGLLIGEFIHSRFRWTSSLQSCEDQDVWNMYRKNL